MSHLWTIPDFKEEVTHLAALQQKRAGSPVVQCMAATWCAKIQAVTSWTSNGILELMNHVETIIQPQGLCPKAVKSFLAMALVIDQCHGGIQWKATTRSSLLAAVEDCNQSFKAAFPDATMIKKWHWHLHARQLCQVWAFTILLYS